MSQDDETYIAQITGYPQDQQQQHGGESALSFIGYLRDGMKRRVNHVLPNEMYFDKFHDCWVKILGPWQQQADSVYGRCYKVQKCCGAPLVYDESSGRTEVADYDTDDTTLSLSSDEDEGG